jgi:hypothetical protein
LRRILRRPDRKLECLIDGLDSMLSFLENPDLPCECPVSILRIAAACAVEVQWRSELPG